MAEWIPIESDGEEWQNMADPASEWGTVVVAPNGDIIFYAYSQVTKKFEDSSAVEVSPLKECIGGYPVLKELMTATSDLTLGYSALTSFTRRFEETSGISLEDV